MPLYCLCEAQNDKLDSQHFGAPNRYCAMTGKDTFPPVALKTPMRCIKTGSRQVLLFNSHEPNTWKDEDRPRELGKHYPNVDVFECPNCRSRVVRE